MIHADFAFCFFECGFNLPAQTTDADQFWDWATRGSIAQIEFQFGLWPQTAATNEPLANGWQAVMDRGHTQEGKICPQRTFAAFMDQATMPGRSWQAHD